MGDRLSIVNISSAQLALYYALVFISFLYLIYKFQKQTFSMIIILLFYNGLFSYIGKDIQNVYRLMLTFFSFYYLARMNALKPISRNMYVFLVFIFFTVVFLFSCYLNGDYFFISFSQYSRYFVLYTLYTILSKYQFDEKLKYRMKEVIYNILIVQVILSLFKFIIMGPTEFVVGSVGSEGGAIATPLPILAFIFFWLKRNGSFSTRDWYIILGFMFIGFVSLKRAIWFIMPIIIGLCMFYIPKQKIPGKVVLYSLITIPLVFYLGVRLNSSLNREGVMGGSFDLAYTLKYAQEYMFGDENSAKKGTGRGGATLLLFDKIKSGQLTENDFFGYGLRYIYATDYEEFQKLDFGISTKGAATGFFQNYIASGFFGILCTLLFAMCIIFKTKNKRLRYVLVAFFSWEYFFYTGIIFRESSLYILLVYIVVFSEKILPVPRIKPQPVQNAVHNYGLERV